MTTEIKESREPAATSAPALVGVVNSSPTHQPSLSTSNNNTDTTMNASNDKNRSYTTIPPSLLQNNPHHGHSHHSHQQQHHRNHTNHTNHLSHHHGGGGGTMTMMPMPPHSPKSPMSRKQQGLGNVNLLNRPRSHSLGTAYTPLLMPQTPPPSLRGLATAAGTSTQGQQRSFSLSPNVYRSNNRNDPTIALGGPKVPILNRMEPSRHIDIQKIMENEQTKERQRAKKLEEEEKDMTADELRKVLKRERYRMSRIAGELAKHKSLAVQNQADAEICEEGRINCLMRRLDDLQIEKGKIIVQLEQEEEMLTNTLQKKLDQVRREKAQLEKLIETEKLSHTTLQSTLTGLNTTTTTTTKKGGKQQDKAAVASGTTTEPPTTKDMNNSSLPSNGDTNKPTVAAIPSSLPPPMDSLAELPDEEDDDEDDDDDDEVYGGGEDYLMEGTTSNSKNNISSDGVAPMET